MDLGFDLVPELGAFFSELDFEVVVVCLVFVIQHLESGVNVRECEFDWFGVRQELKLLQTSFEESKLSVY